MSWHNVVESKIVWAPVGKKALKNGEERQNFIRIGIRFNMGDDSWWFYSFRHKSWTYHFAPVPKTDRLGRYMFENGKPVTTEGQKNHYKNWEEVLGDFHSRSPKLISSLSNAFDSVLEAA
jgi:hypothetical protein